MVENLSLQAVCDDTSIARILRALYSLMRKKYGPFMRKTNSEAAEFKEWVSLYWEKTVKKYQVYQVVVSVAISDAREGVSQPSWDLGGENGR